MTARETREARRFIALLAIAVILTLVSSAVRSTRLEVQDWDCPPAPASCARPVLVVGFPVPYISDYHGISVVGDADIVGALLGEDNFHWTAFLANIAVYFAVSAATMFAVRALRGRGTRER